MEARWWGVLLGGVIALGLLTAGCVDTVEPAASNASKAQAPTDPARAANATGGAPHEDTSQPVALGPPADMWINRTADQDRNGTEGEQAVQGPDRRNGEDPGREDRSNESARASSQRQGSDDQRSSTGHTWKDDQAGQDDGTDDGSDASEASKSGGSDDTSDTYEADGGDGREDSSEKNGTSDEDGAQETSGEDGDTGNQRDRGSHGKTGVPEADEALEDGGSSITS